MGFLILRVIPLFLFLPLLSIEREGKVLWTLGFIEVSSNEVEIVGHALCLVLGRLPWV